MMTEEQAHIAYLKERAQSIGLTFDQYMLFLIFEALDHSPVMNNEVLTPSPWEEGYRNEEFGEEPEEGGEDEEGRLQEGGL